MRALTLIGALALAAAAVPASAVVVAANLTGGTALTAGGTVVVNPTVTSTVTTGLLRSRDVHVIDEGSHTVVNTGVNADRRYQNVAFPSNQSSQPLLAVGSRVRSYLIFFNPNDWGNVGGLGRTAIGNVTFSNDVLGFFHADARLAGSSPYLGKAGLTYGALDGLEGANDSFSFTGATGSFSFRANVNNGDFVRVITEVPEPQTWAMMIIGFGLVGAASRRRITAVAA